MSNPNSFNWYQMRDEVRRLQDQLDWMTVTQESLTVMTLDRDWWRDEALAKTQKSLKRMTDDRDWWREEALAKTQKSLKGMTDDRDWWRDEAMRLRQTIGTGGDMVWQEASAGETTKDGKSKD